MPRRSSRTTHASAGLFTSAEPAVGTPSNTRAELRRERAAQRRRTLVVAAATAVVIAGGTAVVLSDPSESDEPRPLAAVESAAPAKAVAPQSPSPSATSRSTTPTPSTTSPSSKPSPSKKAISRPKPGTAEPKPEPTPTRTPQQAPPAAAAPAGVAEQVLEVVNAERGKAGCGPLALNGKLTSAAQRHSEDMAARHYFDHTNPDGKGPGDRVTAAGYSWQSVGENIAAGQGSPADVMGSWMNSPGHRANIVNCGFREMGLGMYDDASGGPWWTQVFATGW